MKITERDSIFYDVETKNISFLQVSSDLRQLGIKNNKFFLRLNDKSLQGVDPHNPMVMKSDELMFKIINECITNIWYFLREVVRLPAEGGKPIPYELHRGNLAATWCFVNNICCYFDIPRQCGKTGSILANIDWAYLYGATNSLVGFFGPSQELTVENLEKLKKQRALLPPYLQLREQVVVDEILGTVDKEVDNVKKIYNPQTKNTIVAKSGPSSKDKAVRLGRGNTLPIWWVDEFDFTEWVDEIVGAAGPAFGKAHEQALANNSMSSRIFTSTPGDLDSSAGKASMKVINKMCRFSETWYDKGPEFAKKIIDNNSENGIVDITFGYKQLGKDEDWFRRQCKYVNNDPAKIRREILLQRLRSSSESPFDEEDLLALQEINPTVVEEITLLNVYRLDIYRELNSQIPYLIGVDVSSGIDSDNSAVTITNPYTLQIDAEFKSSTIGTHDLKRFLYTLIRKYLPKGLLCIERNHCGDAIIDDLANSQIARNIFYNEKKDLVDNGAVKVDHGNIINEPEKRRNRGVWTGKNSRALMMDLLMVTVQEHKDRLTSKFVLDDILALVRTKNGKIEAGPGAHDDSIMSYLITLYVYHYAKNLKRWGIVKGMKEKDFMDKYNDAQEKDAYAYLAQMSPNDSSYFESQRNIKDQFVYSENFANEVTKYIQQSHHVDKMIGASTYIEDVDIEDDINYDYENDKKNRYNKSHLDSFDDLNSW